MVNPFNNPTLSLFFQAPGLMTIAAMYQKFKCKVFVLIICYRIDMINSAEAVRYEFTSLQIELKAYKTYSIYYIDGEDNRILLKVRTVEYYVVF